MPIPYFHYELFELNDNLDVQLLKVEGLGHIIQIDDFYKYPDDIHHMLESSYVQSWHNGPGSRNFVDYYDCRLAFQHNPNNHPKEMEYQRLIWDLSKTWLGIDCKKVYSPYMFNLFTWKNVPSSNIQMYPHIDDTDTLATVTFLDKIEDGGTAFYKEPVDSHKIGFEEGDNIQIDINKDADLVGVAPAKFNRCIVYPGWYPHGGYIDNHDRYSEGNWRMNQVNFFKLIGSTKIHTPRY